MPASYVYLAMAAYAIVGFIVAYASRTGLGKSMSSYFLADRGLGGIISALTYSATTYSAFMMVGLAGFTYKGGVGALGFELIYLAGLLLVAFFGPRFWLVGKKYDYVSPYEMLGHRYDNKWIAVVAAAAGCIFLIPYAAVQLMGIGYLMNGLSGGSIPFVVGVGIATVLAISWTLIAGLRSVAWTDALQSLLMVITAILVLFFVIYKGLGGFSNFMATLEGELSGHLSVPGPGFFNFRVFLGLTIPWFFFSISNPQVSQRLFVPDSIKSMRTMIKGFLVFGFIYTLISVMWGFSAAALMPGLDSADMATPALLGSQYVPAILGLLAMVGITGAAISTIDSIMLTLSSLVARDVYKNLREVVDEEQEVALGRLVIAGVALVAVIFALRRGGFIATLSVASSVGLMVVVPSIVGAFFWRRATAVGALASIVLGGATALYLQVWEVYPLGHWPGIWSLLVSGVTFVLVSLLSEPPRQRAAEFLDYLDDELTERRIL